MAGNETRYHSPGDDIAALDPRSLQHMGDQALAVSTELASGLPKAGGQRIFMDVLGRGFVQMPLLVGFAIFALLIVALAVLVVRRRSYGLALAAAVAAILFGSAAGWLSTAMVGTLRAGIYWRAHPELSFVAIYATVLLGALVALRTIGRSAAPEQLRVAWWLLFLIVGGLLALAAPGAIIYFLAPPVAVLIGIGASRWWRPAEQVGGLAALLLVYLSWGETLALLEVLFSPGPLWIAAPVAAILMVPALVEAHGLFSRASSLATVGASAVIALLAWAVAAAAPAYSANRQQRFTIEHVTDFTARRSYWSVLNDGAPLPAGYGAAGKWHEGKLASSERLRWLAAAPAAPDVRPPLLQVVEAVAEGNERRLKVRLRANGSERVYLIAPAEARIRTAGVADFVRPIGSDDSSGKFTIACSGRSCDGTELLIDLYNAKPVPITVVGSRNGLPETAAPLVEGRPRNARPQYTPDETVTISRAKL
jgi:hypothetical protein